MSETRIKNLFAKYKTQPISLNQFIGAGLTELDFIEYISYCELLRSACIVSYKLNENKLIGKAWDILCDWICKKINEQHYIKYNIGFLELMIAKQTSAFYTVVFKSSNKFRIDIEYCLYTLVTDMEMTIGTINNYEDDNIDDDDEKEKDYRYYFEDYNIDYIYQNFNSESKLHSYGYYVGESGLCITERQELLLYLIDNKIMDKSEIKDSIKNSIKIFKNNPKQTNAVLDWEHDLQFIDNLNL